MLYWQMLTVIVWLRKIYIFEFEICVGKVYFMMGDVNVGDFACL